MPKKNPELPQVPLYSLLGHLYSIEEEDGSVTTELFVQLLGYKGLHKPALAYLNAMLRFGLLIQNENTLTLTSLARAYVTSPSQENLWAIAAFPEGFRVRLDLLAQGKEDEEAIGRLPQDMEDAFWQSCRILGARNPRGWDKPRIKAMSKRDFKFSVETPARDQPQIARQASAGPLEFSRSDMGLSVLVSPTDMPAPSKALLREVVLDAGGGISPKFIRFGSLSLHFSTDLSPERANEALKIIERIWSHEPPS